MKNELYVRMSEILLDIAGGVEVKRIEAQNLLTDLGLELKTKIRVEQKHIDNGVRQKCEFCPVSLAISEALGCKTLVTNVCCSVSRTEGIWKSYLLSSAVSKFIADFDNGLKVKPFEFDLDFTRRS